MGPDEHFDLYKMLRGDRLEPNKMVPGTPPGPARVPPAPPTIQYPTPVIEHLKRQKIMAQLLRDAQEIS